MAFQTELIERLRLTPIAATFTGLVVHADNSIFYGKLTVGETVGRTATFTSMVRLILQAEWTYKPVSFT